jgi:hypothetical protein
LKIIPTALPLLAPQVIPTNRENLQSRAVGINSRMLNSQ